jgi:hypothetical protein
MSRRRKSRCKDTLRPSFGGTFPRYVLSCARDRAATAPLSNAQANRRQMPKKTASKSDSKATTKRQQSDNKATTKREHVSYPRG